jgi:signal transduction histidine kinase
MPAPSPAPDQSPPLDHEERMRLVRQLHDVVAHRVSAMVVQAAAARQTLDDPARAREAIAAVESTGRLALVELRRVLALLNEEPEAPREPHPDVCD